MAAKLLRKTKNNTGFRDNILYNKQKYASCLENPMFQLVRADAFSGFGFDNEEQKQKKKLVWKFMARTNKQTQDKSKQISYRRTPEGQELREVSLSEAMDMHDGMKVSLTSFSGLKRQCFLKLLKG